MCEPVSVLDKPTLRRRMRQVLELVDDREMRSVELWAKVAALDAYTEATAVMAFASMPTEPSTEGLFARLERDGKQLILPRMQGDVIVAVAAGGGFATGPWGIREPIGDPVDPSVIDLVLVPGAAFTTDGRRLGHGKAYYDRFLPLVRAVTVGVGFHEQLVDDLPTEPHDVVLDHVVTA
jgi:5-formyltetrahydrofolate cyclo-ligase